MRFTNKTDFIARVRARLAPPEAVLQPNLKPLDVEVAGDGSGLAIERLRPAAVLMGLIDRGDDYGVVFTQRPKTMKAHPGQIALPGGKLEEGESFVEAALREAAEEINAPRQNIDVIGQAEPYRTGSGFCVSLIVGEYPSDFKPEPCPHEVADVFETPLSFLMTPENHERGQREFLGVMRSYYAMPYNGRYIWGVTAGMIRNLYDCLYGNNPAS